MRENLPERLQVECDNITRVAAECESDFLKVLMLNSEIFKDFMDMWWAQDVAAEEALATDPVETIQNSDILAQRVMAMAAMLDIFFKRYPHVLAKLYQESQRDQARLVGDLNAELAKIGAAQ